MKDGLTSESNIPILYEDNHLLGIVKPVNVPTQEDASGDPDLVNILKQDIKDRYSKPGNVFVGLIHRLDRPVGGAMIFAKTSKAASRLSESVRSHKFRKVYLAVIHGSLKSSQGRLTDTLLKDSRTNTVSVVPKGTAGAKDAILDYKVIGTSDSLSLVQVELLTGRSHQIRVQFSHAGHPLYGDQKYGVHLNKAGQQIALWSVFVGFPHPVTKEEVTLVSSPPSQYPWDLWPQEQVEL
ncbi:RluA family pseudouridine synthase [Paenibacillus crassostreae]|uniref:RNA pseudouridylate synthase n=1 Tax=Paenibacillus crassostreae TaxID=1763538 RepID=A0A167DN85_9BACL|nr:RluA family pseudouridine synthase [Paenibacillus crassostreae]AOZ91255.1 RNA pseudouridine synthase [Paenibacillus crassostreae]OAB74585.1 RNA pseudouridine synthase [Paenibacillus crassostreae]